MDVLLTAAGAGIVLVALLDLFFTVLFPASRHGPLRKPLSAMIWGGFRLIGRAATGDRRRNILSYSGPVVIGASLVAWLVLLVLGFGFIFKPALGTAILASEGPTDTGWSTAFYYAGFSVTTLGVGDVAAGTGAYRLLTVAAAASGFAFFSMAITYFLSVYSNLIGRNAFAQGLHHLTGRSGAAAELIVRLADEGSLDGAREHLTAKARFLRQTHQSHLFYPVLRHFHYRETYYALPRILLTALDTAALIRSALDRERYARLLGSPALAELVEAANDLIEGLTQGVDPCPPSAERGAAWRRHYAQASATMARAGLSLRGDLETGAEDYAVLRAEWDRPLRSLAEFMLYEWEEIEPQAPGERSG